MLLLYQNKFRKSTENGINKIVVRGIGVPNYSMIMKESQQ